MVLGLAAASSWPRSRRKSKRWLALLGRHNRLYQTVTGEILLRISDRVSYTPLLSSQSPMALTGASCTSPSESTLAFVVRSPLKDAEMQNRSSRRHREHPLVKDDEIGFRR